MSIIPSSIIYGAGVKKKNHRGPGRLNCFVFFLPFFFPLKERGWGYLTCCLVATFDAEKKLLLRHQSQMVMIVVVLFTWFLNPRLL